MLTVVVVHRDRPRACRATVAALLDQGAAVVVVDNASAGGPPALPSGPVEVVRAGANLGFGAAANIGLRRWLADPGAGEWAGVCPHDALPRPRCLERLLAAASSRPRAGLACAELGHDEVPVVDPYFGAMTAPARRGGDWVPAAYPHGTLLVARRQCLGEIGLFDERYFAYCEEADLGIRARQAGWEVGMVWGAVVVNQDLSDLVVAEYLQLRNTLFLVLCHSGPYHALIRLCLAVVEVATRALRGQGGTSPRLRAIADFARGRLGPPPPDVDRPLGARLALGALGGAWRAGVSDRGVKDGESDADGAVMARGCRPGAPPDPAREPAERGGEARQMTAGAGSASTRRAADPRC